MPRQGTTALAFVVFVVVVVVVVAVIFFCVPHIVCAPPYHFYNFYIPLGINVHVFNFSKSMNDACR